MENKIKDDLENEAEKALSRKVNILDLFPEDSQVSQEKLDFLEKNLL